MVAHLGLELLGVGCRRPRRQLVLHLCVRVYTRHGELGGRCAPCGGVRGLKRGGAWGACVWREVRARARAVRLAVVLRVL